MLQRKSRRSSVGLPKLLQRGGQFATEDKVLDVAIALERMFKPRDGGISRQLQKKVAGFLEGNDEVQSRVKEAVEHFYNVRSAIIMGQKMKGKSACWKKRKKRLTRGFGLTRRSLFKMLRDGSPQQ